MLQASMMMPSIYLWNTDKKFLNFLIKLNREFGNSKFRKKTSLETLFVPKYLHNSKKCSTFAAILNG